MNNCVSTANPIPWVNHDRIDLPPALGVMQAVRFEHQHWQRLERAEGELAIGYDAADQVVIVEYHWWRYFSRANSGMEDVYTAEVWRRRDPLTWAYLIRPQQTQYLDVDHGRLRPLLHNHLNIDIGPVSVPEHT